MTIDKIKIIIASTETVLNIIFTPTGKAFQYGGDGRSETPTPIITAVFLLAVQDALYYYYQIAGKNDEFVGSLFAEHDYYCE